MDIFVKHINSGKRTKKLQPRDCACDDINETEGE